MRRRREPKGADHSYPRAYIPPPVLDSREGVGEARSQETPGKGGNRLVVLLRVLKLPGFLGHFQGVAEQAEREGWGFERYLHHLAKVELEERARRKIERLFKGSGLPLEKTLATLELDRLLHH